MAPLQNHCLALLGVMLTLNPHNHARAWSFVPSRSVRLHDPCARSTAVRAISGVPPARRGIRMMSRDGQFVRVSLPKPLGIQLEEVQPGSPGVRVVGLVEGGTAKENGEVGPNMVLVEIGGQDVTGKMFDSIIETLVEAPATVPIDLVFRDPAAAAPSSPPPPVPAPAPSVSACEIKVVSGSGKEAIAVIKAKTGDNLRKTLLAEKVDVYDMVGKMTNCNGGGQCGTCVVQVEEASGWDERTEWETKKLKGRPESQRLACQTLIQGDATILTKPPKK